MNEIKFDFDDILLVPSVSTEVNSRSEIDIFYNDDYKYLPIFTAPMDTTISKDNIKKFIDNKIPSCMVRDDVSFPNTFMSFHSYSLEGFIEEFLVEPIEALTKGDAKYFVLIDIANGHMKRLRDSIFEAKKFYGDHLIIMCGNIANPLTFVELAEAGADYIRLGIGNGQSCFIDDTKINLYDGIQKNIQDIEIGERVLTHKGRYKKIIAKFRKYIKNEDLISINGLICTKEHKFFVINKSDIGLVNMENYLKYAFFIEANELNEQNHMLLEME